MGEKTKRLRGKASNYHSCLSALEVKFWQYFIPSLPLPGIHTAGQRFLYPHSSILWKVHLPNFQSGIAEDLWFKDTMNELLKYKHALVAV